MEDVEVGSILSMGEKISWWGLVGMVVLDLWGFAESRAAKQVSNRYAYR